MLRRMLARCHAEEPNFLNREDYMHIKKMSTKVGLMAMVKCTTLFFVTLVNALF